MDLIEPRKQLAQKRENLRQRYAQFQDFAVKLMKQGLVKRGEHGVFINQLARDPYSVGRVSAKMRDATKKFMTLQINLQQQAMLLLELEHSIDYYEQHGTHNVDTAQSRVTA
jgi:hypothetical protein